MNPENDNEVYYEDENYRDLLKLQPDDFYLHLPVQLPFLKWLFEFRLQLLLFMSIRPNYFGMRHTLNPQAQWFSDWVFLNHYQFDYIGKKTWKPSLTDRFRYQWLMRQGYAKEQKFYFDLFERNNDKKVSVKERKFLKKYEQCRYWSYFDHVRDDELAFFRMGIDADQSLDGEDKPFFPNIVYSFSDDPRLAYYAGNNQMLTEYLPPIQSWWQRRKAKKLINKKWDGDQKVTYADIRPMFNADTTKIHDLQFLLHCYEKYGGEPKDEEEKKLFVTLYPLYNRELQHIAQSMHLPELEKLTVSQKRRQLNPLYTAYKQRWFYKNPTKDFEKVFHGVTRDEYQEIVNQQYKDFEVKRRPVSKTKNKSDAKKLSESLLKILKR